jgi:Ca2+-binding EF-hand superfamily protein
MSSFLPKKGQSKQSNLAQFAWKLLESGDSQGEDTGASNPAMGLHLKSIFLSLDSDNDDLLTRPQLVEAIRLAGLNPRDALIRKYSSAMSATASDSAVFGSTDTTISQTNAHTQNVAKRKQSVVPPVYFKTDLHTFVRVTEAELVNKNNEIEEEMVRLLRQFAEPGTDNISVKHIRHLLHETLAPTRLSVLETAEFLKSSDLLNMKNSMNTKIIDESLMFVDIRVLARKILVGNGSGTGEENSKAVNTEDSEGNIDEMY